jgi:hypothetical protein
MNGATTVFTQWVKVLISYPPFRAAPKMADKRTVVGTVKKQRPLREDLGSFLDL